MYFPDHKFRFEARVEFKAARDKEWYINITVTVLDIIHCPVFYYLKHDVS
jgi:hypothetical protein